MIDAFWRRSAHDHGALAGERPPRTRAEGGAQGRLCGLQGARGGVNGGCRGVHHLGGWVGGEQVGNHHPYLVGQGQLIVEPRHITPRASLDLRGQVGEFLDETKYEVGPSERNRRTRNGNRRSGRVEVRPNRPLPPRRGPVAHPVDQTIGGRAQRGRRVRM